MPNKLDLYLQWGINEPYYSNTPEEQELVTKFSALYSIAKSAKESLPYASTENVLKWRKAYNGTLGALKRDGTESTRKSDQLRKVIYEFVESKIDNSIPKPHMIAKHKRDTILIERTEEFLKYNVDNIFTKYLNDRSERSTYVDGTSWYKVWWDSTANSHETSGEVRIDVKTVDQIVPQPGVIDWRKLEYIFELDQMSINTIYTLYGRLISPTSSDSSTPAGSNTQADMSTVTVVTCYYFNDKGTVGRFMWSLNSEQVICNEEEWQIRRLRKCTRCGTIVNFSEMCPACGNRSFRYESAKEEEIEEDLYDVVNPYQSGETDDKTRDRPEPRIFLTKGTKIPYYVVRQLPFVPRPAVSSIDTLYGISEAMVLLDTQDVINKLLTKIKEKTLRSGAVITKAERNKLKDTDDTFKIVSVKTSEEASMLQVRQVLADTQQDTLLASILYESAKNASGVTSSFQGKEDSTATSGKAKQIAAAQSAGRIESLRVMKTAAFAGVYELVLKYLLAFSDEERSYVKVLPNGKTEELSWNKYLFLDKDKNGEIYYRDNFVFSTDAASTLATNRVAMWQETQDKLVNGALGNPADERTLELYWTLMSQQQYPLAQLALAGIQENSHHLPPDVENAIMQNPQIMQAIMGMIQQSQGSQQGGARVGAGRPDDGFTHRATVEQGNEQSRAVGRQVLDAAQGSETGGNII